MIIEFEETADALSKGYPVGVIELQATLELVPENPIFEAGHSMWSRRFLIHRNGDVRKRWFPVRAAERWRKSRGVYYHRNGSKQVQIITFEYFYLGPEIVALFTRPIPRPTVIHLSTMSKLTKSATTVPTPPPSRPQYIFGYGSLIQSESRTRTVSSAQFAAPVIARGISRGWYDQTGGPSWNPTYLGAVAEKGATTNGVIYPVSAQDMEANNQRETGYKPTRIDPSDITMLDGSKQAPDADIWYYANVTKKTASKAHPLVQSYIDICLDGCLEVEAAYPLAKEANFAERFIRTCTDWKTPWINDRIYPWRPTIYIPRANQIDALLRKVLGNKLFARITLK